MTPSTASSEIAASQTHRFGVGSLDIRLSLVRRRGKAAGICMGTHLWVPGSPEPRRFRRLPGRLAADEPHAQCATKVLTNCQRPDKLQLTQSGSFDDAGIVDVMSRGMGGRMAGAGVPGMGRINYGAPQRPTAPLKSIVPRIVGY